MRDGFPVDKYVLIGGETTLKTTLIVHVPKNFTSGDDFFMNNGPPLLHGRYYHSCGTFQNNGTTFVIAAGGNNEADSSTTQVLTEIWDPSSDDGWIKGRD